MAEQLGVLEVQAEPTLTFTVDRVPEPMLAVLARSVVPTHELSAVPATIGPGAVVG